MNIIKQKGSATVEFAMMIPILLILVFMVSALGVTFYRLNAVTKSVQVAARYLSDICVPQEIAKNSKTWKYCTAAEITNAQNLAVYGNTSASGQIAIVPDLTPAKIVITDLGDSKVQVNHHVQVVATYDSSLILGGILDGLMQLVGGNTATEFMTLHASSVMRFTQ
jgi:Flp pilus assembly protein TadG